MAVIMGKSCLTNPVAFYGGHQWTREELQVSPIWSSLQPLIWSNIITLKSETYGFDAWTVRGTRNCLGGCTQRVQSMPECSSENQQQVVSISLRDAHWDPNYSMSSSMTVEVTPHEQWRGFTGGKGCHPQGPLSGVKGGPMENSWGSTMPSARSCTWVRTIPNIRQRRSQIRLPHSTWDTAFYSMFHLPPCL